MGNGFKLPGLQKFLQQNLNHEVGRLEGFDKLVGDEVKSSPQFQDNLASFAVAYGLGVQGLNRGGLGTNLLPPEIEMKRLAALEKPCCIGGVRPDHAGADVPVRARRLPGARQGHDPPVQIGGGPGEGHRDFARRTAQVAAFDKAKGEWEGKYAEGKALITEPSDQAKWPQFLKLISAYFPDPEREYGLDPDAPESQNELEKLRVHIDAIKPVWRADLNTEWFATNPGRFQAAHASHRRRESSQRRGLGDPARVSPLQPLSQYQDAGRPGADGHVGRRPQADRFWPLPVPHRKGAQEAQLAVAAALRRRPYRAGLDGRRQGMDDREREPAQQSRQ